MGTGFTGGGIGLEQPLRCPTASSSGTSMATDYLNEIHGTIIAERPEHLGGVAPRGRVRDIDPATGGGLLADNGGPTQTIAIRLDAGQPGDRRRGPGDRTATDQRGVQRDAEPDLGAFEAEQVGPPAPFRIEAETLARVSGFKAGEPRRRLGRHGDQVADPEAEAHARFTFTEQDGLYDLDLGYFDENGRQVASRGLRRRRRDRQLPLPAELSAARSANARRGRSGTSRRWRSRRAT